MVGKKVTDERTYFNLYLLHWIYENVTSTFEKYFCGIDEPQNVDDEELSLELKYKLNTDTDSIYIDIAGGVLKPSPR